MRKIMLSIGALQCQGIRDACKSNFYVIAYEPLKEVFEQYERLRKGHCLLSKRFTCFNKAVSNFNGEAELRIDRGASTISKRGPNEIYNGSYKVDVVSLDSVLEPLEVVHVLNINCEGSEYPIILNTKTENLLKCEQIWVEYHCHVPRLHFTREMVHECSKRLIDIGYIVSKITKENPYYEYTKKRG